MKKRGGINIKNSKDRGTWAELCFAVRSMEEELRPARPFGEPSGYDFLVHHKSTRIFRVQVKSTIRKQYRCYQCTIRTRNHIYKKDSFDFVAAYVIPGNVWYILPEKIVRGMSTVGLSPAMGGSKYDAYKEAWYLLRGETPGTIPCIHACAEEWVDDAAKPDEEIANVSTQELFDCAEDAGNILAESSASRLSAGLDDSAFN